jgi:hypothetical protein
MNNLFINVILNETSDSKVMGIWIGKNKSKIKLIISNFSFGGVSEVKGGMLLFWALCGLRDEGLQGQKMKKFWKQISKICIVNISASEPSI